MRLRSLLLLSTVAMALSVAALVGWRHLPTKYPTMQEAIRAGDLADLRRHLRRGDDPDGIDGSGWLALEVAVVCSDTDAGELLLHHGAAVNGIGGHIPLHLAAGWGKVRMAKLLIGHGAAVDAADYYGYTALHAAASHGHVAVVQVLLAHGARANARLEYPWARYTPLTLAVEAGHDDVAQVLRAHGGKE